MNQQYLVIVEAAPQNYAAFSPDVPGCVATGDTVEETVANMREAIVFHLEGLRSAGYPIPEPATVARYVSV